VAEAEVYERIQVVGQVLKVYIFFVHL
jgi:hypothetical protein